VVLLGSGLLVYLFLQRSTRQAQPVNERPAATSAQTEGQPPVIDTPRPAQTSDSFLDELLGRDPAPAIQEQEAREVVAARILVRFLIAALLAAVLAFGRRRSGQVQKRNPYVAQTQILLAVVAAAMMMIVGDSAARAFGIFAAASLVRFRTNIRDPKETTVLLICLGLGLASGVGRLDMAVILTLFVLVALWILEHFESGQVSRRMAVRVATRNVDQTHPVLKRIFEKHGFGTELRQLEREDEEGTAGQIVYELSLGASANTDQISDEILAEDPKNIANLEWEPKKTSTYIYN
jgi:uncharacterized membrane protein YhiD involved in acid resistance